MCIRDSGTGEWLGHLLFDQDASKGDCLVPVMTHGIAYKDRLPVASFTKPTASAWTYL